MAEISICNLCGVGKHIVENQIEREGSICSVCSSVWRTRAVGHCVSIGVGKVGVPLHNLDPDWSLRGLGIGDSVDLASSLSTKFNYTNTHLNDFPKLDLTAIAEELNGYFDFVVCSEILEHVLPPVDLALQNLFRLLKPGGFTVISVPLLRVTNRVYVSNNGDLDFAASVNTIEYYPDLTSCKMIRGEFHWETNQGKFIDHNPELHGGGDDVIAFRLWSLMDLQARLKLLGFIDVFEPTRYWSDSGVSATDAGILIARRPI